MYNEYYLSSREWVQFKDSAASSCQSPPNDRNARHSTKRLNQLLETFMHFEAMTLSKVLFQKPFLIFKKSHEH
jgi:Subunit of cleavage factor IA Pcf11